MEIDNSAAKTLSGSVLCWGSGLIGAIDGNSPVVVLLGIIAGLALGAVGIWQRLDDARSKRLLIRAEAAEMEAEDWRRRFKVAQAQLEDSNSDLETLKKQRGPHGPDALNRDP